jgi:hypothetical protein
MCDYALSLGNVLNKATTMECGVLHSDNSEWNKLLKEMPYELQDVYFMQEYQKLGEKQEKGVAELFYCKDNQGNIAVYIYLKRKVEQWKGMGEYYDIETSYGYGGPISNSNDASFLKAFEDNFIQYCKKSDIIAEFIRFHTLIENHDIFQKNIEVIHNRYTICIDLDKSIDELWNVQLTSQNRNKIRKGQKSGLEIEISNDYEKFIDLYYETMNKVNADDFYFFESDYFKELIHVPNTVILFVKLEKEVIAASFFIRCGEYLHYHLAGSKKEYLNKYAPNNFMLWEAIKYGKSIGCKKLHLGGGLSDSKDDRLFQFKNSFSKDIKDFYIGKRIHNMEVYNALINEWEREHGRKAKLLLEYRTC